MARCKGTDNNGASAPANSERTCGALHYYIYPLFRHFKHIPAGFFAKSAMYTKTLHISRHFLCDGSVIINARHSDRSHPKPVTASGNDACRGILRPPSRVCRPSGFPDWEKSPNICSYSAPLRQVYSRRKGAGLGCSKRTHAPPFAHKRTHGHCCPCAPFMDRLQL